MSGTTPGIVGTKNHSILAAGQYFGFRMTASTIAQLKLLHNRAGVPLSGFN
jgi:hypothetical protein